MTMTAYVGRLLLLCTDTELVTCIGQQRLSATAHLKWCQIRRQLYTVHGGYNGEWLPVAGVFLPNRSQANYTKILGDTHWMSTSPTLRLWPSTQYTAFSRVPLTFTSADGDSRRQLQTTGMANTGRTVSAITRQSPFLTTSSFSYCR